MTMTMDAKAMPDMQASVTIDFVRRRDEAARRLGVSTKTLSRLEQRGEIEATRITDRIKGFRDSAINKFLNSRTAAV